MKSFLQKNWPWVTAVAMLWLTTAVFLYVSLARNGGHLVYPLDDTYIHMAIAKNLAHHGVFGVTPYGFTSASSSLIWPLLLGLAYLIFGVNEIAPLAINIFYASILLFAAHRLLVNHVQSTLVIFVTLVGLIYLTPLIPLIFGGMEHVIQIIVTLLFAYLAAHVIAEPGHGRARGWLLVLAPVVTLTRYEGVFIVLVVCALLMLRRRFRDAFVLGALAAVPLVLYGIASLAGGWFPVPNSIVGKSSGPEDVGSWTSVALYGLRGFERLFNNPHLWGVMSAVVLVYVVLLRKKRWHDRGVALLIIFALSFFAHIQFAEIAYLYRYEAYLVALGIVVLGMTVGGHFVRRSEATTASKSSRVTTLVLLVALVVTMRPLTHRGIKSFGRTIQASTNIYEQQYQVGLFLAKYYPDTGVATNDAGAVNFLTGIHNLDLLGLTDIDVAKARMRDEYGKEKIREMAKERNVKVAFVYDHWYARWGGLPEEWAKVGEWTIGSDISVGGRTVSIYAAEPAELNALIENLEEFSGSLPVGVDHTP